uniref:Uncharacterized protein n=1 Tax=Paramormyrops kingsleyae TaxID=1676925 RepID=A0A3B3QR30_9TELE
MCIYCSYRGCPLNHTNSAEDGLQAPSPQTGLYLLQQFLKSLFFLHSYFKVES